MLARLAWPWLIPNASIFTIISSTLLRGSVDIQANGYAYELRLKAASDRLEQRPCSVSASSVQASRQADIGEAARHDLFAACLDAIRELRLCLIRTDAPLLRSFI
eukprot:6172487-Pleurochrysis_carterae.AAC.1